jgi:hypothetical protein
MDKQSHWQIVRGTIDKFAGESGLLSPPFVKHALEQTAQVAFNEGQSYAISSLLTTEQMAERLLVSTRRVRALAKSRNIGWQISRGVWLFQPDDVGKLRPGIPGRPHKITKM